VPPSGSAPPGWNQPLLSAAGEFDDLSATFDPIAGGLHIAAAIAVGSGDSRGIVYANGRVLNGGERVTTAPLGQDGLGYDGEPDIAVDADGTVWIVFTRYECAGCTPTISSGVFVTNNVDGAWSEPVQIAGAQAYDPSIVVRGGIAHVTYAFGQMPEQPAYPIYYATNETGSWTSLELAANASLPRLIFDGEGIPVAVYSTTTGIGWTSFPSIDAQGTQEVPGPSGEVDGLFVTLDDSALVHLVYADPSGGLYEEGQHLSGGWTTPVPVNVGRLQLDSVRFAGGGVGVVGTGRGLDEPGAAFVYGSDGRTVPIISGEVTRTDLTGDSNFYSIVYAYAGTVGTAEHGIWFTGHNGGL